MGTAEWPGGFAEYVVVPQSTLFPLPDSLSFAEGAAIESLSIAVHIASRADLKPGQSVAVLGSGSIGGLFSALSRHLGAAPILAADIHRHCLDRACTRLGATRGFLLPDDRVRDKMLEASGGEGLDVVAVCADDPGLLVLALEIIKKRGAVVVVALLNEQELHFKAYSIIRKEASIIGTYAASLHDFQQAVELAGQHRVDITAIISHQLPIEEAQRGFQLAATKEEQAIKVVLTFA
jgi:L-iditol 2-dehydrogenase